MRNVLISGGAGFIGSYLCEALYARGYSITILDNLSPQIHERWEKSFLWKKINGKCSFINGDVRSRDDWRRALCETDAVVHLAAETGTGQSMYEVTRYYEVNVQGTSQLLDLLVNEPHRVKKIIVASSRAIYGEGKYLSRTHGIQYPESRRATDLTKGVYELIDANGDKMGALPTDEDSRLHPTSIYGLTKLAQEQMIMLVGKQLGIPSTALRLQNVYGPGQSLSNPYTGLLAVFSTRIRNGNPLEVYEDGKETRDFVYISDVVKAFVLSLEDTAAEHQIFNVGSGVATPILQVAKLMKDYFDSDSHIDVCGKYRVGDIRHNVADLTRITSKLGYEPSVSFVEGLRAFTDWVALQEPVIDRYEQSTKEIEAKGLMGTGTQR